MHTTTARSTTPPALAAAVLSAHAVGVDWRVIRAFREAAMGRPDALDRDAARWLHDILRAAGVT